jgi:hypothetical protein
VVFLGMSKRMPLWYLPTPRVLTFCDHCLLYFYAVQHVCLEQCLKSTEEFVDHCSYEIEFIKYIENVLVKVLKLIHLLMN